MSPAGGTELATTLCEGTLSLAPVPVGSQVPFTLDQLPAMSAVLRDVFLSLHMEKHLPPTHAFSRSMESHAPLKPHPEEWSQLKGVILEVLIGLYQRDCRRPFCPEGHWVAPALSTNSIPPQLFIENEGMWDTPSQSCDICMASM